MRSRNPLLLVLGAIVFISVAAAACGNDELAAPTTVVVVPTATASVVVEKPNPAPTVDTRPITARVDPKPLVPEPAVLHAPLTGNELVAPEFVDTGEWINTDPFTMAELRGKVVLIDFWTYTCINCIRTLPYLRSWHTKYADSGLTIVGVHTPEFEFEKLYDNVVDAVAKFDLRYSVVQDNDFGTWVAFKNRFWPAKYLIDKNGKIRYTHFGEGAYQETELVIRELLEETGADLDGISSEAAPQPEFDTKARTGDPMTSLTRELYAGYERNYGALASQGQVPPYVIQPEYYEEPDVDVLYVDPGSHQNHFLYISGLWRNEAERLVHARSTTGYEDYIFIKFFATSVNAVMAPIDESAWFELMVTIDDRPLTPDEAGYDIMFDDDGNSFVTVDDDRMYSLVNKETFSGHDLKLSSNSAEFSIFAFTFGAYVGGERES